MREPGFTESVYASGVIKSKNQYSVYATVSGLIQKILVREIFLGVALSIGVLGGLPGLVFGFSLSLVIDQIPFTTAALPTITTYPVNYDPQFYLIGISFALVTTWLAGFFPAQKAGKVDPVVIIRGK